MFFLGILGVLFLSCKAQEINSNKLLKIKSTHSINNQLIYKLLEKLEERKDLFSNKSDCIYLDIKKIGYQEMMTLGVNYFFNDNTRLQVNYQNKIETGLSVDNDALLVQLQVKF